jgi:hypothetical protein
MSHETEKPCLSMRRQRLAAVLVGTFAIQGCAVNPAKNTARTNEALGVVFYTQEKAYLMRVKDAIKTTNYDGTVETIEEAKYAERTYKISGTGFGQGATLIDEQDFYRLSGDQASADRVARIRKSHRRKTQLGIGLLVLGGGVSFTGQLLPIIDGKDEKSSVAPIVTGAGVALGVLGIVAWIIGRKGMSKQQQLPTELAKRTAQTVSVCYKELGGTFDCAVRPGGRAPAPADGPRSTE